LVYDATFSFDNDKSILYSENVKSGPKDKNNSSSEFELTELKNRSIQFHLSALNFLKSFMNALKNLDTSVDIENAMVINDELAEILNEAESHYKKFVTKYNYSKESLELYILFLKNSMNRGDLADQYIQMLENNENNENEKSGVVKVGNQTNSVYDRSEKMSSSITSDAGSRKARVLKKNVLNRCQRPLYKLYNVMQILTTLSIIIGIIGNVFYKDSFTRIISNIQVFIHISQSPVIINNLARAVRVLSLATASGIDPTYLPCSFLISNALEFLETKYIPNIYKSHTIESQGYTTVNPIENGVIDRILDINYYKTVMKIDRKGRIIIERLNYTDIRTPEYLDNKDIRYFIENSKGQFGNLLLNSIGLSHNAINVVISKQMLTFIVIAAFVLFYMIFVSFKIIIPNANQNFKFSRSVISLYRSLPPSTNYFNEQSDDYSEQIHELCDNYDVVDEGISKKKKKNKIPNSKLIKKSLITYCLIVTFFLLFPFCTVFIFNKESKDMINLLINSTKRAYYLSSISYLSIEYILNDNKYYNTGEALRLMTDSGLQLQNIETKIKSGYYGGKSPSEYPIFDKLNNNPGCVRLKEMEFQCPLREFTEFYTKELAESPIDYMMIEYLNKFNEFINNDYGNRNFNRSDYEDILEMFIESTTNPYIQTFISLSDDIIGHIDVMNEIGTNKLAEDAFLYLNISLVGHCISSLLIVIFFFIFVSRNIKKQLRVTDALTNILFSMPYTVYNTSPKIKNFISTGRIDNSNTV